MILSLLLTALLAGLCLSSAPLTMVESVQSPSYAYVESVIPLTTYKVEDDSFFEAYESFGVYDANTYTFTLGKTYYLTEVSAQIDVDDGSYTITAFKFARFNDYNASRYVSAPAFSSYSFSSYQPVSSEIHVRSRADIGIRGLVENTNITFGSYNVVFGGQTNSYIDLNYGISSSGPYNIVMNRVSLMYHVRDLIQPVMASTTAIYTQGYNDGHNEGYEEGYDYGWDVGYNRGASESPEFSPSNVMNNLFFTIISVPIRILNGFNDFVIWETPVTALLVSFAVMGLMLWLIKRFIK